MSDVNSARLVASGPILTFGESRLKKKTCFCAELLKEELEEDDGGTLARKVGEAVTNTIGVVVTAIDIPLGECCPKTRPINEPYVMEIHDPVNTSKRRRRPLVADI